MIKVAISEDGEVVWRGLIDSEHFNKLIDLADGFSDESVLTAPSPDKDKL